MKDEKFTIEEFKNYCKQQNYMVDILLNLNEENIRKANIKKDSSEICEWKYFNPPIEGMYYWKTSCCGYKNREMIFPYCPYCGKGIKVVE